MNSKPTRHSDFYMEYIIFLVEDTLFKVPQSPFNHSGVFATIFTLPAGKNVAEGYDDEHPFKLEGINKEDFVRFLHYLHPHCGKVGWSAATVADWTSVLKLSTMWQFAEMRELAISHLSNRIDLVAKVILGKRYNVPRWLLGGYEGLVNRKEAISIAEAEKSGYATAFRISVIREENTAEVIQEYKPRGHKKISHRECIPRIRREFEIELKEAGMDLAVDVPVGEVSKRDDMDEGDPWED